MRLRGWDVTKGGVPPQGSKYSRYSDRRHKRGVQYKDINTGYVYDSTGRRVIAYEPSLTKIREKRLKTQKSPTATLDKSKRYYRVIR